MTAITTRQTTAAGATNKGSALTNTEMDANFVNLNLYKVEQTSATGAALIPGGAEAQRPASPVNGQLRYNSEKSQFEGYQGGEWKPIGGGDSSPMFSVMWWPQRSAVPAGYVAADGQTLSRATYPDAWAGINAGNVPTVADATWIGTTTERGKYTAGDGSSTFRLPDYNGKFAGSLGAVFLRGDGALSAAVAGVIQRDALQAHTHNYSAPYNGGTGPADSIYSRVNTQTGGVTGAVNSARTDAETRPLNVTGCWVIKLFGEVTNPGSVNVTQLASEVAQAYKPANILGTASQSAGVPTGAIIERGSNANGEYVKFADGTQICFGEVTVALTASLPSGTWYYQIDSGRTFPAAFVATPTATFAPITMNVCSASTASVTTTTYMLMLVGGSAAIISGYKWLAVGRWY